MRTKQFLFALSICGASLFSGSALLAKEIKMKVSGMTCDFCAQGIQKKLKKEAGVTEVKVDLDAKTVSVALKEGSDISDERLKKLITDSGYELKEINRAEK
jgi:mercuric ion binding protein